MNDRAALWNAAGGLAAAGEAAALATVARKRGSLPLAGDAKMLVTAAGRSLGTVGGGCVEAAVVEQALQTVRVGRPTVVRHSLNAGGTAREHLNRVRCPIGEDIGADTPAEIAVSVVAELIKLRRTGAESRVPAAEKV